MQNVANTISATVAARYRLSTLRRECLCYLLATCQCLKDLLSWLVVTYKN